MADLRRLFEALGFSSVQTFIASGNVIFGSASRSPQALERRIERRLHDALGFEVATFIRSTGDLARIARYKPFRKAELSAAGNALYIAFLAGNPSARAKQKLLALTSDVDDLHVAGREAYWLCRKKMSESDFSGALLEKTLGLRATLRNATTVRKMAVQYSRRP